MFNNFGEAFNSLDLSCSDENNIENIEEEANDIVNNTLKQLKHKLKNRREERYPVNRPGKLRESEEGIHDKVQKLVEKYEKRILNRMSDLGINCYSQRS